MKVWTSTKGIEYTIVYDETDSDIDKRALQVNLYGVYRPSAAEARQDYLVLKALHHPGALIVTGARL